MIRVHILLPPYLILLSLQLSTALHDHACCYDEQTVEITFDFIEALYSAYLTYAKWPSNKIYYDVDPHMDPVIRHYVTKAIEYFNTETDTCVWWEQYYPDGSEDKSKHWVSFFQTRGSSEDILSADLGWNLVGANINTHIYLGPKNAKALLEGGILWGKNVYKRFTEEDDHGIRYITEIIHEMMHVMSFTHEHQRADRDCWVYVSDTGSYKPATRCNGTLRLWNWFRCNESGIMTNDVHRVINNLHGSFERFVDSHFTYYSRNFPYDPSSVMHYPESRPEYYSHNPDTPLGRKDGKLSDIDLWKLNYVYCHEIAWCDLYFDCAVNLNSYRFNPNCFREGPTYGKNSTCTMCTRP